MKRFGRSKTAVLPEIYFGPIFHGYNEKCACDWFSSESPRWAQAYQKLEDMGYDDIRILTYLGLCFDTALLTFYQRKYEDNDEIDRAWFAYELRRKIENTFVSEITFFCCDRFQDAIDYVIECQPYMDGIIVKQAKLYEDSNIIVH